MRIADRMKDITENIVASYDVRVKALKDLVNNTHKTINGFAADRKEMGAEQAKNLADFISGLENSVGSMLKGFQASHKEMSAEQAARLGAFVRSIAKDIAAQLKGFRADREKMSEELKASLAKYIRDIASDVKKLLGDTRKLMGEYGSDSAKAKSTWLGMSASLARSRKGGMMPRIEVGEKIATVTESMEKKSKKKAGKKGKKKSK